MKFKIGDLVRVRKDLVTGRKYGSDIFIPEMEIYKGKIYSIESVYEKIKKYDLNGVDFCWTDGMLEKANIDDLIKQFLDENKEVFKNFDVNFTIKDKPQILDENEKRYLRAVIRPFRDRFVCVVKSKSIDCEYQFIEISVKSIYGGLTDIEFPLFKANTMYKGMVDGKVYTLEELGL